MGSLKLSTTFANAPTELAPKPGLYVEMVGAVVSAVVNTYVVPLMPANGTFDASLITPDTIDTVYCMPAVLRSLVGSIVTAVVEYVTCASPAAMFTALPVAGVIMMLPVPACIFSLKVSTIFADAATELAPKPGLYVDMMGPARKR